MARSKRYYLKFIWDEIRRQEVTDAHMRSKTGHGLDFYRAAATHNTIALTVLEEALDALGFELKIVEKETP